MTMDNDDTAGTGCENLPGELVPFEEFTYNNSKMGCLITWNLRRLNFSGVSVSMQLKSCHTCMPNINNCFTCRELCTSMRVFLIIELPSYNISSLVSINSLRFGITCIYCTIMKQ